MILEPGYQIIIGCPRLDCRGTVAPGRAPFPDSYLVNASHYFMTVPYLRGG